MKKLAAQDRYHDAVENYAYWFEKAVSEMKIFRFCMTEVGYNQAAFNLRQVTKSLYDGILLVFTHYKPKTDDLDQLRKKEKIIWNPTPLGVD